MENIWNLINAFGGRKSSGALFLVILGTIIHFFSKNGLNSEIATYLISIYGIFCGSNLGTKFGSKPKESE